MNQPRRNAWTTFGQPIALLAAMVAAALLVTVLITLSHPTGPAVLPTPRPNTAPAAPQEAR
ncbi:hypothetical protein [Nonomuraea sp. NPDC050643]|uniref:hypothetical protein n=1 Tax=Nonomuraea sp. NPDC050643 TaxID=3155660 RepID=UPI0033ED238C